MEAWVISTYFCDYCFLLLDYNRRALNWALLEDYYLFTLRNPFLKYAAWEVDPFEDLARYEDYKRLGS